MTHATYQAARATYQSQAVGTAGPGQLVIMLYDGALAAIAKSRTAMETGGRDTIELVNKELTRAQNIITELQLSLDHERGGQIARNLSDIYDFCLAALTQANLAKEAGNLDVVSGHLNGLREAFVVAASSIARGEA